MTSARPDRPLEPTSVDGSTPVDDEAAGGAHLAIADAAVIVTGTSRGLGAAIRADLLGRGASVIAVDRGGERPVDGPSESGDGAIDLRVDWSHPEAAERCVAIAVDHLRRRDGRTTGDTAAGSRWLGVVHNAGTLGRIGPLGTLDAADIAASVHINLTVAAQLCNEAARASHRTAIPAKVLLVSSGAARRPYAGWSVYCATKSALDHLARTANLESATGSDVGGPPLVVHSLAPGVVDTDMQRSIRDTPAERFPQRPRFVALHEAGDLLPPDVAARRLLDRWLDPDEPLVDST